ncbi:MAG: hypothetical protein PWQ25_1571 [Deferribacteres bacterium]|nr:hypothetical protein [Deferribacteres bacterium]
MKKNKKGMALVTTLILSTIALLIVGTAYYLLSSGTKISGIQSRYTTALEAAKGASDYVINVILDKFDNISDEETTCSSLSECSGYSGNCVNLPAKGYNNLGGFNVCAKVLDSKYFVDEDMMIYTVEVRAVNPSNSNEKSIVQFVYQVE